MNSISKLTLARILIATLSCTILLELCAVRIASAAGLIAFIGGDRNVYYCEGSCREPASCVTCPRKGMEVRLDGIVPAADESPKTYGWPAISPDSEKLAFVGASRGGSRPSFTVEIYDLKSGSSNRIFESPTEEPIYIFWSPDSENISFLVTERQGLLLIVANIKNKTEPRVAASGVPLYYDWIDPSHPLAIHTNSGKRGLDDERISLVTLGTASEQKDKALYRGFAPFKAPAWSPDRKHLAYIAMNNGHTSLFVADEKGEAPKAMVALPPGQNSFIWSPDSRFIAFATGQASGSLGFKGLNLLELANGKVRKLADRMIDAYFFSPDAHQLACIETAPRSSSFLWSIVDVRTRKRRVLGAFLTTREETIAYRYFDQLALSHSIWSPDSKAIVFAGKLLGVGRSKKSSDEPEDPKVWILGADGSARRQIATGALAFWSLPHAR